jgi:hypothetical protein
MRLRRQENTYNGEFVFQQAGTFLAHTPVEYIT